MAPRALPKLWRHALNAVAEDKDVWIVGQHENDAST